MFVIHLCRSTNNVSELDGIIKGLTLAIHLDFQSLVVERDSPIIILALIRLLCGSILDKMSLNWKLSFRLSHLSTQTFF